MDVLMRIQMRRLPFDELAEARELSGNLLGRSGLDFVERHPAAVAVGELPQIDVQTQIKVRVRARVGGCLLSRRPTHHQARARHDTPFVRLYDTPIDPLTLAEVVRIDDQPAPSQRRLLRVSSRPAQASR